MKPGSCHDFSIFKSSVIGQKLQNGVFGDGYLLGDSGYPCVPYLLTPFGHPKTEEELRFNAAHNATTRCTVDRAFGILKWRFYCL